MAIKTFTTGEVLTASDTNTYLANAGLVYVTSTTVGSAVSSVTVSNCFSSTYHAYRVVWTNGTMSNNTDLQLKLGATATNYYQWMTYGGYLSGAATPLGASVNNGTQWNWFGGGDSNAAVADFELYGPNLARYTYARSLGFYAPASNSGFTSGVLRDTTQYTAFTLTPAAGTLTGGTLTVYGMRLP